VLSTAGDMHLGGDDFDKVYVFLTSLLFWLYFFGCSIFMNIELKPIFIFKIGPLQHRIKHS
jgi:hypothetical protein